MQVYNDLEALKSILKEKESKLKQIKQSNVISDDEIEQDHDQDQEQEQELYCKIGNKNTICLYGLRKKLPVSLRPEQWERLYQFLMSGKLHEFIKNNREYL